MAVTEAQAMEAIKPIEDPELHLGIVDLGLIYAVDITPLPAAGPTGPGLRTEPSSAASAGGGVNPQPEGEEVKLTMTFTSPFCPYGPALKAQVQQALARLPGVAQAAVNIVFTPPWDPRTMASEDCKIALGIGGWEEDEGQGPGGDVENQR